MISIFLVIIYIGGWSSVCQPYIEGATALPDEFIARNDGFWRSPEIDFRYETEARKVMVDFKFDALLQVSLHREPPEVGLVEKLTGSLYWWVEQYVPALH